MTIHKIMKCKHGNELNECHACFANNILGNFVRVPNYFGNIQADTFDYLRELRNEEHEEDCDCDDCNLAFGERLCGYCKENMKEYRGDKACTECANNLKEIK